ncbi:MAG: DUF3040 domain-containing protein, partial [Mycobacteriales bacterium]
MPLSEHEQRLLDQIERALYAEDPKFATTVRSTDLRTHMKRRLRRAAAVFALGFVLLLSGVITNFAVGIAGFVVMLVALMMALSAWNRLNGSGPTTTTAPSRSRREGKQKKPHGSAKERLEERWRKRW